ncbi:Flp pilus assembly protein CpaB [Acetobacter sp.]|jgi:pilus assembly protein CpaB|uniref:Flp pilus assembly protein CpaB n=1 Tax=Acetobacter sp. TaxID=440 RepID=UPI0025C44B12|nr:Flp pilus assembly protein CpaB [Acetobacter sp.]MCH4090137.1 Flp pilus assembly protein CpaB [Acetobacter sp.]MCI1298832.1 Flp pilus assembly protein CpaB [Acetobacter sp.]MCI1314852.1 Flp pilus assembly protein CpaB [Acetobacter sp.]
MKLYRYILYFSVAVLTIVCFVLMFRLATKQQPAPKIVQVTKPEPMVAVLVASKQLYAGEVLHPTDITGASIPKAFVLPGTVMDSSAARQNVVGSLLRVSIPKNAPVRGEDVVHAGDGGFLAALLSPGKRGVAMPVDPASAVGSLIWPGDYVDVLLMPTETHGEDSEGLETSSVKTLLQNVHVVAVDQHLVRGKGPIAAETQSARTVVLEVSAEDAQKLALAQKLGHLTLTLRSMTKSAEDVSSAGATWDDDIFESRVKEKKSKENKVEETQNSLHVFNGLTEVKDNAH